MHRPPLSRLLVRGNVPASTLLVPLNKCLTMLVRVHEMRSSPPDPPLRQAAHYAEVNTVPILTSTMVSSGEQPCGLPLAQRHNRRALLRCCCLRSRTPAM